MVILNNKNNRWLKIGKDKFRFFSVLMCQNRTGVIYANSTFGNTQNKYNIITKPYTSGNYSLKIVSVDDKNNISTGITGTTTIPAKVFFPKNVVIKSVAGNVVTITWEAPNSGGEVVTGYKVYGNGGDGLISRTVPLMTYGATIRQAVLTLADGNWLFVVEAVSATHESVNWFAVDTTLPSSEIIPSPIVDEFAPANITLQNVNYGKCRIQFVCSDASIRYINIYHDSGTGTIDWVTPAFRFARQTGEYQDYTTGQVCFTENFTFKFGIRVENNYGNLEINVKEYQVVLDGIRPDNVEELTIEV